MFCSIRHGFIDRFSEKSDSSLALWAAETRLSQFKGIDRRDGLPGVIARSIEERNKLFYIYYLHQFIQSI